MFHLLEFLPRFGFRLRHPETFTPPVISQEHAAHAAPGWSPTLRFQFRRRLVRDLPIAAIVPAVDEFLEPDRVVIPSFLRHRLEKKITETFPSVAGREHDAIIAVDIPFLFDVEGA
jgi:hypothetical protein